MVQAVAPEGIVMVTWANFHYLDFTLNWIQHVQAANITAYLVGAMDNELLEALLELGVNCFAMQSGLSTGDFGWGSHQFHKMVCKHKLSARLLPVQCGWDSCLPVVCRFL